MESLRRTFHPKHTTYPSDGSGRDHYIRYDNGGLVPQCLPSIFLNSRLKTQAALTPAPRLDATAFKYTSDGTGRDFYVVVDSGGLHSAYTPGGKKDMFITGLRGDPRRRYASEGDFFTWANRTWKAPSTRAKKKRERIVISELTNRLYPSPRSHRSSTESQSPH